MSIPGPFFRIEANPHGGWNWTPFPDPRYRFDSAAGLWRVRYAARSDEGAARERYRDSGSLVPTDHATHSLVTLTGRVRVLDLRQESVLDALHLDDQISTSRTNPWWEAAHRLTDSAQEWWGEHVHGIVYRSRTTPATSLNLAFFAHAPLTGRSVQVETCADLLDRLVLTRGFTVDFAY